MYKATVTLFWRDKTTTDADGNEKEKPPVSQDVKGFFIEGNALILVEDEQLSYVIPLDSLDTAAIQTKGEADEASTGDDNRSETDEGSPVIKLPTPEA